jgi:NitT/TauT family transport system permease protein
MYPVSRDRQVKFRPEWDWRDLLLLLAVLALLFGIIRTAAQFGGDYDPNLPIETSLYVLPAYTAQTLLRMVVAYLLSLGFTLVYAYSAYRSKAASLILIPLLDILQSIPVLSFLPGVVLDFLRRSPTLRVLKSRVWKPLGQAFNQGIVNRFPYPTSATHPRQRSAIVQWLNWFFLSGVTFIVLWGTWEAVMLLGVLNWAEWQQVIIGAIITALRVFTALVLSLTWTVPVGVAIGRNPRLAQILQPLVQIAASVPATALFPVLLLALTQVGGGLQIGSIILMMLGTMWYLLFNVIAGAQSIPSDLFEAARVYKLSRWQRWQTVILPGIFPYLITGIITAVGGAWNASIVSEYIEFKGRVVETSGLGATISQATATGNFSLLLAATAVMSLVVVLTNRLVWRPLYRLAQDKYQLIE